jgi:hypothetical protein
MQTVPSPIRRLREHVTQFFFQRHSGIFQVQNLFTMFAAARSLRAAVPRSGSYAVGRYIPFSRQN